MEKIELINMVLDSIVSNAEAIAKMTRRGKQPEDWWQKIPELKAIKERLVPVVKRELAEIAGK